MYLSTEVASVVRLDFKLGGCLKWKYCKGRERDTSLDSTSKYLSLIGPRFTGKNIIYPYRNLNQNESKVYTSCIKIYNYFKTVTTIVYYITKIF